jgi:hypothetical protein
MIGIPKKEYIKPGSSMRIGIVIETTILDPINNQQRNNALNI